MSVDNTKLSSLRGRKIGMVVRGERGLIIFYSAAGKVIMMVHHDHLFDRVGDLFEDDLDARKK